MYITKHHPERILILSISIITLVKFCLIGNGFLSIPDEWRYLNSVNSLHHLYQLQFKEALKDIFSTQGRPGDAIIKIVPAAIDYLYSTIFCKSISNGKNPYFIFIFNYIIYCSILFLHYNSSKLLLHKKLQALISVLLFACLTNSYIYLRHALPYDASLLVLYYTIYRILKRTEANNLTYKSAFVIGVVSCSGYLIYPGYFPLLFSSLLLLITNNISKANYKTRGGYALIYIAGFVSCIGGFELLSRLGGRSFILDSFHLTNTINQGTFSESFSFIIKYLFQVETLTGVLLMFGLLLFFISTVMAINYKFSIQYELVKVVFLVLSVLFLAYASAGYFFHKMVMYGRLLHQYMPFISIFTVYGFNQLFLRITTSKEKKVLSFAIILIAVINFGLNFMHYMSFAYPISVESKIRKAYKSKRIEKVTEYDNIWFNSNNKEVLSKSVDSNRADVILVNAFYLYPVSDLSKYHAFIPPNNYKLIETKPHFINFPAYKFEGYNIEERDNITSLNLQIRYYINEKSK